MGSGSHNGRSAVSAATTCAQRPSAARSAAPCRRRRPRRRMRPAAKGRIVPRAVAASLLCAATVVGLPDGPGSRPTVGGTGTVRGQVLDGAGNPLPNVVVGMRRAKDGRERSSPDRYVRTGKRGDFRFQGVEPGRYVIFANSRTHGTLLIPDVDVLPG